MRGKVEWTGETATVNGITPAYAGKSTWFRLALGDNEDHPRLCGEKHLAYTPMQRHRGSPPPMRGKVLLWREG